MEPEHRGKKGAGLESQNENADMFALYLMNIWENAILHLYQSADIIR